MTGTRQNFARTMVRRRPDYRRVGDAVSFPGIDPRTWVSLARVDTDEDAIVWDEEEGWLVDVTFVGGELDGEGPVVATMGSLAQGNGQGRYLPPRAGGLVLVSVPNGDANDEVVILQQVHTTNEVAATTINGDTIVERDAGNGEVAAIETHIDAFPQEDADQQWRTRRVATSGAHRLHGETLELGIPDADQPFARGNDLADALNNLSSALDTFLNALAIIPVLIPPPPGSPVANVNPAAIATLRTAITTFQNARNQYLSTRISGD